MRDQHQVDEYRDERQANDAQQVGNVSTRFCASTGSMSRDISPATMRSARRTAEWASDKPGDDAVRTAEGAVAGVTLRQIMTPIDGLAVDRLNGRPGQAQR